MCPENSLQLFNFLCIISASSLYLEVVQNLGTNLSCLLISSAGKEHENEICYHPFRMTPYLIKVQNAKNTEDQLCCVLLAEKVHSGYEGTNTAVILSERAGILQTDIY